MIKIYTKPYCTSSQKMMKWFDKEGILYIEKPRKDFVRGDIVNILKAVDGGIEELISTRSKASEGIADDLINWPLDTTIDYLYENKELLRLPIVTNYEIYQIGYNKNDITVFKPRFMERR